MRLLKDMRLLSKVRLLTQVYGIALTTVQHCIVMLSLTTEQYCTVLPSLQNYIPYCHSSQKKWHPMKHAVSHSYLLFTRI